MAAENLAVSVRCRPLKSDERQSQTLEVLEDDGLVKINGRDYCFDQVFSHDSSQEEVFTIVVKPLIYQVLQGYNCTVFAYGQTGTGKTYTMEGHRSAERLSSDAAGMVPRAVTNILQALQLKNETFTIKVTFIEVFSEEVYDLLTEDTSKLRIYDDSQKKGSVVVEGAREIVVSSTTDILDILSQGALKRQTASTLLNARSSRSHSIFSIKINQGARVGKLNLVDLAGSENIARSGAQDKQAREAGNINQSLLTLTRVITALVERRPHVPYRESKLTRILQDSLGGSTRTSMIATISPAETDVNNTLGTLDYALRARSITNRLEANYNVQKKIPDDLSREIQALKEKHAAEISEKEYKIRNEVATEFRRESEKFKETIKAQYEKRMHELSQQVVELSKRYEDVEKKYEDLMKENENSKKGEEEFDKLEEELNRREEEFNKKEKEFKAREEEFKAREEEFMAREEEFMAREEDFNLKEQGFKKKEEDLVKQIKIANNLSEYRNDLLKKVENDLKTSILRHMERDKLDLEKDKVIQEKHGEIVALKAQLGQTADLNSTSEAKQLIIPELEAPTTTEDEDNENHKKASKVRKRVPTPEGCNDYANMTFDGDDEIVQVSVKKARKKLNVAGKKRDLYQHLTLSGKKSRLRNTDEDVVELSPISPPVRITRARATKRKLNY